MVVVFQKDLQKYLQQQLESSTQSCDSDMCVNDLLLYTENLMEDAIVLSPFYFPPTSLSAAIIFYGTISPDR